MRKSILALTILQCSLFSSCRKNHKTNHSAAPAPSGTAVPFGESERPNFNLLEREAEVVQKYNAVGIAVEFWQGQEAKVRDLEINQLLQLLPEFEKRRSLISRLVILGSKLHFYKNESKSLQIDLEPGVQEAVRYLEVFDKVRALEAKLGGTVLKSFIEDAELLEEDLRYYEKINLVDLLQNRPYIKVILLSGYMKFDTTSGYFYLKTDATVEQIKDRVEGIGRWHQLSRDLNIVIEDNTQDLLMNSFVSAVDSLIAKSDLIKPVSDLVKKIEIAREFSEIAFDLKSGIFRMSRFDAENSEDLWLALANYKVVVSSLGIPTEISDSVRSRPEELKDALKLILNNIEVVRVKLDKIKGLRIGFDKETKFGADQILWVAPEQSSDEFRIFVESL